MIAPPSDVNSQSRVEQVTRPAVICYAAALVGGKEGQRGHFEALSYRLRLLEEPR